MRPGTLNIPTARVFLPLLQPKRFKGARGGRGSGKSHFFAEMLVEECLLQPGTRALCIREHQVSLKQSVKPLIESKIQKLGVGHYFQVQDTVIKTPGGGIIVFQGMSSQTEESVKSFEGFRIAWVEEAQTFSQRSMVLLPPTIRVAGSELWFSWNRKKRTDPVDVFFRNASGDHAICVVANWRDNPWFPEVLMKDLQFDKRRCYDTYRHVWEGEYQSRSQARVFNNWRVGDYKDFKSRDKVERLYYGADFGFAVDPSVLLEGYIEDRNLYLTAEAYEVGVEVDHLPFLFAGTEDERINELNAQAYATLTHEQKARWTGIPGCQRWPITADSARPETISYMKRHGFPTMRASRKGAGSIGEGIEFLKSYDIIIHPECPRVIEEFENYSYKVDKMTEEVLPVLIDEKNHTVDAARYMVERLRRAKMGLH